MKGPAPRPAIERLQEKVVVDPGTGCHVWTGATNGKGGYGVILDQRRMTYTHRVAFEARNGPIPQGQVVDHICRNRSCCNPDHLRAVTQKENLASGFSPNFIAYRTGRCLSGHALSFISKTSSKRGCNVCRNARRRMTRQESVSV